jgi:hypothetical protein
MEKDQTEAEHTQKRRLLPEEIQEQLVITLLKNGQLLVHGPIFNSFLFRKLMCGAEQIVLEETQRKVAAEAERLGGLSLPQERKIQLVS